MMGKKTISIKDEAYERLKRLKKEGESFTDLVNRLTKKRSILELNELVSEEEAESLRAAVEEGSEKGREARRKEIGG